MTHADAYAAGYAACANDAPLSPPVELDEDGALAWGNGWFDCLLAMMRKLVSDEESLIERGQTCS